ncbi:uncharacterized protein E0L32_006571 [Thyridium curvatum]|uniref:Uncharacterized protein n=1 Tax=Thyridium curvatum TaxID=1093900 RepID=A0A507B1K1_9PEZI|nr:uncharacterized protein E0L32_006571 [Thyridium curvatum]TPX12926.1 hypothetical protein E0L32_006571 [Thyridium curvatum]
MVALGGSINPTSAPITTASFLPPATSTLRAWQRVAVPVSGPGAARDRKIWKRVGGAAYGYGVEKFAEVAAELKSQGYGSRKRARDAAHVPAYGSGSWDLKIREHQDGRWDLVTARVSVAAAKEADDRMVEQSSANMTPKRKSTFPEQKLKWVPRKRHNTRYPIDPPQKETPMIAEYQPLINIDVTTDDVEAIAQQAIVQQMDKKQMRRRSTRRLSRRISLAPIQETADESPIMISPVKATPYYSSPMKRRSPVKATPKKVAMSPLKEFTLSATPTKVTIETASTKTPAGSSPSALSTPQTINGEIKALSRLADSSSPLLSEFSSLVFDQPNPDAHVEPEHEARRRVSLQNARRSDRRSSGVRRLLSFETQKAPGRRHSMMPGSAEASEAKGRRHTLDVCLAGDQEIRLDVTSPTAEQQVEANMENLNANDGSISKPEAQTEPQAGPVDVDVKNNLDIFGQSPMTMSSPQMSSTLTQAEEATIPSSSPVKAGSDVIHQSGSPIHNALGIVEDVTLPDASVAEPQSNQEESHDLSESPMQDFTPTNSSPSAIDLSTPEKISTEMFTTLSTPITKGRALSSPLRFSSAKKLPTPPGEEHNADVESPVEATQQDMQDVFMDDRDLDADEEMSDTDAEATATITTDLAQEVAQIMEGSNESASASPNASRSQESMQAELVHEDGGIQRGPDSLIVTVKVDTDVLMLADAESAEDVAQMPLPSTEFVHEVQTEADANMIEDEAEDGEVHSPGFTPINERSSSSPLSSPPEEVAEPDDTMTGNLDFDADVHPDDFTETVTLDIEAAEQQDDATETMNLQVEEEVAEKRLSIQDDSETEMLRRFVTRVKADKTAKAAAAARAKTLRPNRRSGSLGSTTSDSGSPIARNETTPLSASKRLPLGQKDHNMSPSPTKKRKGADETAHRGSLLSKPDLEDISPPKPKRRRKNAELENDSVFNPEFQPGGKGKTETAATDDGPAPRRSSRNKTARNLRSTATTANNSAVMSMIPVRLPGSLCTDDSNVNLGMRRNEERDLAAVTRHNTRKNKGASVHPSVVISRQQDDPNWRMKELKEVFEAREAAAAAAAAPEEGAPTSRKRTRGGKGKGVRWDETLVRVQGQDEGPVVMKAVTAPLDESVAPPQAEDAEEAKDEAEEERLEVVAPEPARKKQKKSAAAIATAAPEKKEEEEQTAAKEKEAEPVKEKAQQPAARPRTRASRLRAPTPRKLAAPTAAVGKENKPKLEPTPVEKTAAPAPASAAKKAPPAAARMATRRTRISGLGMSGNGTPAPKRRATRGTGA